MPYTPGTYIVCDVQVSQREFQALDAIQALGTCLYCGRTITPRYNNVARHMRACGRGLSLLEIEKRLADRLTEGRDDGPPQHGGAPAFPKAAIAKATNTQCTPNGTIKDGTWTPNTKGGA